MLQFTLVIHPQKYSGYYVQNRVWLSDVLLCIAYLNIRIVINFYRSSLYYNSMCVHACVCNVGGHILLPHVMHDIASQVYACVSIVNVRVQIAHKKICNWLCKNSLKRKFYCMYLRPFFSLLGSLINEICFFT